MKKVKTVAIHNIGVRINTTRKDRDQWARIVCNKTGTVLHVGQPKYIKRVAMKRYDTFASF